MINTRSPEYRDEYINIKTPILFTFFIFLILIICLLASTLNEISGDYKDLAVEYDNLCQVNLELSDINNALLIENMDLQEAKNAYEEEIAELKSEMLTMKSVIKTQNKIPSNSVNSSAIPSHSGNYGSKKTYMYYTSITNKSSAQWKIQQRATTNGYGIRVIQEDGREYVCIAVGTGWHFSVGTKVFVTTTNGGFYAIIGDIKGDRATTADHLKGTDGSITEFIVDKNLNSHAKKMGNLNVIADYSGDVLDIKAV